MIRNFSELATDESIKVAREALEKNGITVVVVENGQQAKAKVLEMVPAGAEIMNMSSVTVDLIGLAEELNKSGKFNSVRNKLTEMSDKKDTTFDGKKLGAAPDWTVGSVHAVTEDGKAIIASASGSQLPSYAYGSNHVLWIVGSQKIVKDFDQGMERINEYVFPLENERAMKAYGMASSINKVLLINKESTAGRITMIIVKEKLGF